MTPNFIRRTLCGAVKLSVAWAARCILDLWRCALGYLRAQWGTSDRTRYLKSRMDKKPRDRDWLGPLSGPISATLALLGLIGVLKTNADTIGWKIVAGVGLIVSVVWAIWFTFGKTSGNAVVLGAPTRRVLIHPTKLRFAAFLLPVGIIAAIGIVFAAGRTADYSDLFVGGGPYSPVVVFDSAPRGADVKFAWIIYADDDPLLQSKENADRVIRAGRTLCRSRVGQGQYWAVFELNGRQLTTSFTALGPTVVKADFKSGSTKEIHPR